MRLCLPLAVSACPGEVAAGGGVWYGWGMKIVRDDVARATADAIVDSACGEVQVGAGADSAVFLRGGRELRTRRQALGTLGEGTAAAVAAGGELGCRYVVFTVVPPRQEGEGRDGEETLRACCRAALEAARAAGCESVAFPLLGAGRRGWRTGRSGRCS